MTNCNAKVHTLAVAGTSKEGASNKGQGLYIQTWRHDLHPSRKLGEVNLDVFSTARFFHSCYQKKQGQLIAMLCSLFCNLNKPWKLCTRWNQLLHRTPFQSPVQDQDAQEDADAAATGFEAEYVVYQHLLSCLHGTTVTTPFEVKGTKDRKFRRGWFHTWTILGNRMEMLATQRWLRDPTMTSHAESHSRQTVCVSYSSTVLQVFARFCLTFVS